MTVFPNSAPDSLTPKNWNFVVGPAHVPAAEDGADPDEVDVAVVVPIVLLAAVLLEGGAVTVLAPGRH